MKIVFAEEAPDVTIIPRADGEMGLQYLQHAMPDLIILDLNLPLVSGKEVLQRLKKDSKFASIPVLIFSSSVSAADIDECTRLGAVAYMQKPLSLRETHDMVRQMLIYL